LADRYIKYIITTDAAGAITGMKRVEAGAQSLSGRLQETGSKLKSFGSGMTSLGHKLNAISLPLLAVGGYAVKSAIDFQTSMTMLQTQAGASAKEVKGLESTVLKLTGLEQGPKELAEALYPIRSVGLRGADAIKALTAASKGSAISGAGVVETADALSGALRTNMKDIGSASGAMDVMNKIVGLGKMHLSDLNEAFTTGILPSAKVAGLGFRDVGAALAAMTRQGIPASVEATRLRTNLSQFEAPRGAALKALKSIGLGQYTLAEDLRKPSGLIVALKTLQEHLSKVGQNQQGNVLARAFGGARGSANVAGLLNSLPEMTAIRQKLGGAGAGQFAEAYGTRVKTAAGQIATAVSDGKKALVQLGQTLIPIVIPALTKFSKLVINGIEWLKRLPKPVKDVIVGFTLLLAAGGPLLIFFGNMISATGAIIGGFGRVVPVLRTFGITAATAGEEATGGFAGFVAYLGPLVAMVAALEAINRLTGHKHNVAHEVFHAGKKLGQSVARSPLAQLEKPALYGTAGANAFTNPFDNPSLQGELLRAGIGPRQENTPFGRMMKQLIGAEMEAHGRGAFAPIENHVHVHLNGQEISHEVAKHIRNNPSVARPVAEGVAKYAQHRSPVARAIP
jgi:TP901 family phage tail tape measure protein